jgi:hypothetical protein
VLLHSRLANNRGWITIPPRPKSMSWEIFLGSGERLPYILID